MLRNKLLVAGLALGLLVASGAVFKLVTGQCPVGCLIQHLHGSQPAAPAN